MKAFETTATTEKSKHLLPDKPLPVYGKGKVRYKHAEKFKFVQNAICEDLKKNGKTFKNPVLYLKPKILLKNKIN